MKLNSNFISIIFRVALIRLFKLLNVIGEILLFTRRKLRVSIKPQMVLLLVRIRRSFRKRVNYS